VAAGKSSYSKSLRAIGQDLEARGIKTFELQAEARLYVVECGYQEPPSPTPVTLHYTPQDIEELDRSGRTKRGRISAPKDFVTLVQVFRAVGGYLDKNKCRLIGLSNNGLPSRELLLRVEYENADGERIVDDRNGTAIYGLCVSMYKQRGKDLDAADRFVYWRRRTG
jgi:hypothetical protein